MYEYWECVESMCAEWEWECGVEPTGVEELREVEVIDEGRVGGVEIRYFPRRFPEAVVEKNDAAYVFGAFLIFFFNIAKRVDLSGFGSKQCVCEGDLRR